MSEISKICIVSEWLRGFPDEGIHNLAQHLMDEWRATHSVQAVRIGSDLRVNRLFLSWRLRKTLRAIDPDVIFYVSPSSVKLAALLRARILKIYSPRSRVFVVATQPVNYGVFTKLLAHLVVPSGIFVQAPRTKEELRDIPCPVHFLPSGVDTGRFMPCDEARKRSLRKKYKESEDGFVVLHVGHMSRGRNVGALGRVAQLKGVRVIIVGSTSTPQDEELAEELTQKGARLIREFIPSIEELYQLADAYVFPVVSENAAIGVPLSVLEAMACNLPVITTPFGGLPWMFQRRDGFLYFNDENELPDLIAEARRLGGCSTRRMVEPYDWKKVASGAIEAIRGGDDSR